MTAAGVLEYVLRSLNTLGEHSELLASGDRLHCAIRLSEAQIKSLHRQLSSHPVELEAGRSKGSWPEASAQAAIRQLSASQTAFIVVESERDQSRVLVEAELRKR